MSSNFAQEEDDDRGAVGEERRVRTDVRRTGDVREVLLRHGALELLHQRRRPGARHPQHQAGDAQRKRPVQVTVLPLFGSKYPTEFVKIPIPLKLIVPKNISFLILVV